MNTLQYNDTMRFSAQTRPKEVKGQINATTFFWKRYLYRLVFGAFDFNNIPDGWDKDYMLVHLFGNGFFTITDTAMGVLPLHCGISGVNVFERPTTVNVANVVLGDFSRTIDVDCALVKLQYNYMGIMDVINRYADLLASADKGIAVNLINSMATMILFADDKAQAATMQKMYDDMSCGKPAVFVRRSTVQKSDIYFNNVKQNFVADDIQIVQRKLIDSYLTCIGINKCNAVSTHGKPYADICSRGSFSDSAFPAGNNNNFTHKFFLRFNRKFILSHNRFKNNMPVFN